MQPRFPFLAVQVPGLRSADVTALLFELGCTGVELQDQDTHSTRDDREQPAGRAPPPPPGTVRVVAYYPNVEAAELARRQLVELEPELRPAVEEVVGDEWRDAYKKYFAPFSLTSTVTVVPPWTDAAELADGGRVLLLDPGRAFGTGLHSSTALAAQALEQEAAPLLSQGVLLDVGTGSGILALLGLLLGAPRALAIDNDLEVIDVVWDNARRNGLQDRIEVRCGSLDQVDGRFPVVVANIEARTLAAMAGELQARVAPGGQLVLSGVLAERADEVARSYLTGDEWSLVRTRRRGDGRHGWVAFILQRGSSR